MIAAAWPRPDPLAERLLHVDPVRQTLTHGTIRELPARLRPGDTLVVNDAATLPASFRARNADVEVRLLERLGADRAWRALLFGAGDFHTPTERRPLPPSLPASTVLDLGVHLRATVTRVDPDSPRLVDLAFDRDGAALWSALFEHGRPIQYAHVAVPLPLWHVQSHFATEPWAVELASAGRPLTWGMLTTLRRRGVTVTSITHAAGLSSTGSDTLDAKLPTRERYRITEPARDAISGTIRRGGRVIAVGTTVVRALESSALAHEGAIAAETRDTTLRIGPGFRPAVVSGVLSGMHAPGTSHFALLEAFAPAALLARAHAEATRSGYLEHEFGDSCLVLSG